MSEFYDQLESKYLGKTGRVVSPKGDWGRDFTCVDFSITDEEGKKAVLTVESVDRRVQHIPFDPVKGTPATAEEMPDPYERCTMLNPSWFRPGAAEHKAKPEPHETHEKVAHTPVHHGK